MAQKDRPLSRRPVTLRQKRGQDRTFQPHGKHLIAGEWISGEKTFRSDPAHGEAHDYSVGTPEQVDAACRAAEEAFLSYGYSSREDRARFLNLIADEIEARANTITAIGTSETGLPETRLQGERVRTTGQLRFFAEHILKGDHLDRRHDEALPDRQTPACDAAIDQGEIVQGGAIRPKSNRDDAALPLQ